MTKTKTTYIYHFENTLGETFEKSFNSHNEAETFTENYITNTEPLTKAEFRHAHVKVL